MVKRRVPPPDESALAVPVRVRPGAGRDRVGGRYEGPHGPALIIAVGAPAVDGKVITGLSIKDVLLSGIGFVPEDRTEDGLVAGFSIANIDVIHSDVAHGVRHCEDHRAVDQQGHEPDHLIRNHIHFGVLARHDLASPRSGGLAHLVPSAGPLWSLWSGGSQVLWPVHS